MKKHIKYLFLIVASLLTYSQEKKTNNTHLKEKLDLCLSVEGDLFRTLGNIGVFFWNAGMRYEKDEDGNKIKDEYSNYIYLYPERKIETLKNSIGGEFRLDYIVNPLVRIGTGINLIVYNESIFGIPINNSGYFCEAQIKAKRNSDTYLFGKFGSVTSNFTNNISLNHYQYVTGIGIKNEYIGLDVGLKFFSTPKEKKTAFLENHEIEGPEQTYLESARLMLRFTAKFL